MSATKRRRAVSIDSLTLGNYSPKKDGITQTVLRAWLKCRLAFLIVINKWKHIDKIRTTSYGSMMHRLLEKTYQRDNPPREKILKIWIDQFCKSRRDELRLRNPDDVELDKTVALVTMSEYVQFYETDFERKNVIKTEGVFEENFHGYILRGRKDLQYTDDKGKTAMIMEHKNLSRINEDKLTLLLDLDLQNNYYILTEAMRSKVEIVGLLYNIIRRTGMKPHKDEHLQEFGERLRKDIQKRPEYYFIRFDVTFTTGMKKKFEEELYIVLEEIQDFCEGKIPLYKNRNSCEGKFVCEYLDACVTGKLSMMYQQTKYLFEELED